MKNDPWPVASSQQPVKGSRVIRVEWRERGRVKRDTGRDILEEGRKTMAHGPVTRQNRVEVLPWRDNQPNTSEFKALSPGIPYP